MSTAAAAVAVVALLLWPAVNVAGRIMRAAGRASCAKARAWLTLGCAHADAVHCVRRGVVFVMILADRAVEGRKRGFAVVGSPSGTWVTRILTNQFAPIESVVGGNGEEGGDGRRIELDNRN